MKGQIYYDKWGIEGITAQDRRVWTGHCRTILAKLRERPRTTRELEQWSGKFSNRLLDLRRNGYVIDCKRGMGPQGSTYTLISEGNPIPSLDQIY